MVILLWVRILLSPTHLRGGYDLLTATVFPPVVVAPSMGLSPVHRFRLTVGIHRSLYVLFRSTNVRNNIPGPFAETHPPPSR